MVPTRRISRAFTTTLAALLFALGCPAALAAPALAAAGGGGCPERETQQAFGQFGDRSNYVLAPNGAFEDSGVWSLSRAERVNDNETFYVHSPRDRRALAIGAGGSATSARICVEITDPAMRFFVKKLGTSDSSLRVDVLFEDLTGSSRSVRIATIGGGDAWQPTPKIVVLANVLALPPDGTLDVRFRMSVPEGTEDMWRIDDVYVDPYRKG
jgi:hypothetical protein